MAHKTWRLTDTRTDTYVDEIAIGPHQVDGTATGYSIVKRRLRGGLRDGVDVIEVDNGLCRFVVVPTRGMGIWRASLGDVHVGWNSPIRGPVHPQWVPVMEPSGLGWLDGFDELLVRCGLESNGAPDFAADGRLTYPLHGRIANLPAHFVTVSVDGDTGEIEVTGAVDESRFHFAKLRLTSTIRTRAGQPGMRITDTVENLSADPAEIQLLYHINFGPPLLGQGAACIAPAKTVVPRNAWSAQGINQWNQYSAPRPGSEEQVYFLQLLADADGRSRAMLKNQDGAIGVSIDFLTTQLPYFTLWKNPAADQDGYVTGLEPGTNFPNPRTFEGAHGRFVALKPGGTTTFELGLTVHRGTDEVTRAENVVAELRRGAEPEVFVEPRVDWCAT